jgi:hypothetical protein
VTNMDLHSIFVGILELTLLGVTAFYAGFVLLSYLTYGPRPRPQFELREPTRSAENLAVWAGIKLVALLVPVGRPILAMLSEASAEVGDWFLSNLHHESR